MYQVLGWVSVILFLTVTAPYWLRNLNQSVPVLKRETLTQWTKLLRRIHKPLGIILMVAPPVHGYLVLGAFRLHTGSLAAATLIITAILGALFYFTRKPGCFTSHKRTALLSVILILLHLLAPGAVNYLLN
ncbi:hypothetical protein [Sporomusa termitida]|uniref:Uncharacterized protein n=1 Tax=Sporomusa termitida TaxID=2377 RepID=A0A517DQ87_9FIRM|nr:hypothetical protein [Sporomusa termitida]QDR79521.1 hypothetical protein SPTER_07960 [Sporomusa termitida]